MQEVRSIKVGYAARARRFVMQVRDARGQVTAEKVRSVLRVCPSLRLCGRWMAEAGCVSRWRMDD
ncbi:MAG: hypothetical protein O2954_20970 [bacterium]|nr:hypothetical protein [bacterium]